MKDDPWMVRNDFSAFASSEENMRYDEALLQSLQPNERVLREYRWRHPGITLSYKQQCPEYLHQFDASTRITGGGIVFHSPGDCVFSIAGWRKDVIFKGSLKHVLGTISNHIRQALTDAGVCVDHAPSTASVNREFCTQYPTPFELSVNGKKICGLTIRRFRDRCLIQGIVHLQKTHATFHSVTLCDHRFRQNVRFEGLLLQGLFDGH